MPPLILLLLYIALGFAALILSIIGGLCLKEKLCPGGKSNTGFTVGGEDEENDHEQSFMAAYSSNDPTTNNLEMEVEIDTRSIRTVPSTVNCANMSSRPSAPTLHTYSESTPQTGRRLQRASSRPNFYCSSSSIQRPLEDIRQTQHDLLRNNIRFTEDDINYNLIIAVDAHPTVFGGYCINVREKCVTFYSVNVKDLPWRFVNPSVNSEFEMKNLLFALMLWFEKIKDARKILIYTGNRAINYDNNRYGRRATKLLEHYSGCEGIQVGNDCRHHVSWNRDPKSFAIHIQPAEDLCSENFPEFIDFIHDYYGIEHDKFEGTHDVDQSHSDGTSTPVHEVSGNYHLYVDKVKETMKAWTEPCNKCGYVDDETASYLSLNRVSSV